MTMNQDVLSGLESRHPAAALSANSWFGRWKRVLPSGIAARLTICTALIGVAVIASITFYMFSRSADTLRALEQAAMLRTLDSVELRLTARLSGARADALFFSRAPVVAGVGRATANAGIDPVDGRSLAQLETELNDVFVAMLSARPQYTEIRLLDTAGQAIVDVGRGADGALQALPPRVASAIENDVFDRASKLPVGAIYTGEIDPHGETAVQLAGPVFDKSGALRGVIVIHLGIARLLAAIDEQYRDVPSLYYLADERGRLLDGPVGIRDPAHANPPRGLQTGDEATVRSIFLGDASRPGVVALGGDTYLTALRRVFFDPSMPARFIAIAEFRSETLLLGDMNALRNQTLLVASGGLLLGLLVVSWLARFISQPLRRMTRLAADVAAGKRSVDLSDFSGRRDEAGELARAFEHMLREIVLRQTELAHQAEELRRSNSELSHFAYVASHDLQEPLRMVASYLELLRRRYQGKLDAEADEFIGYAVDGATRMKTLINDVLGYARVSNSSLALRVVDVGKVARSAAVLLAGKIEASGAELSFGELPRVSADPPTIERLLTNLIDNAVKYHGAAAPRVALSSRRVGEFWEISVADNGIGIAPDFREKVFDIFTRLHSRDKYEGSGIGLAACRRIVERHGGRIWVAEAPGGGSIFTFTLPATPAGETTDAEG